MCIQPIPPKPAVYCAKIEAHDLNKIESEPQLIKTIEHDNLKDTVIESSLSIMNDQFPDGCSLTVTYTKKER